MKKYLISSTFSISIQYLREYKAVALTKPILEISELVSATKKINVKISPRPRRLLNRVSHEACFYFILQSLKYLQSLAHHEKPETSWRLEMRLW